MINGIVLFAYEQQNYEYTVSYEKIDDGEIGIFK